MRPPPMTWQSGLRDPGRVPASEVHVPAALKALTCAAGRTTVGSTSTRRVALDTTAHEDDFAPGQLRARIRPMRRFLLFSTGLACLLASVPAFALKQSVHRDISEDACLSAGLPSGFCKRLGVAAYNVDAEEWEDLSAHSQIPEGATTCDAAGATLGRIAGLSASARTQASELAKSSSRDGNILLAQTLGRALHTIQDNCAHAGMPNIQHAWYSVSDTCKDTTESPDLTPEARLCSELETQKVFVALLSMLSQQGLSSGDLVVKELPQMSGPHNTPAPLESNLATHWPPRGGVCEFLHSAAKWDGRDRRWDNGIVIPELQAQVGASFAGKGLLAFEACASNSEALLAPSLDAVYDVSKGPADCGAISLYCLGKGDATDEPPPYEAEAAAPPASEAPAAEGCGMTRTRPTGESPALLMLCALGLLAWRARRG